MSANDVILQRAFAQARFAAEAAPTTAGSPCGTKTTSLAAFRGSGFSREQNSPPAFPRTPLRQHGAALLEFALSFALFLFVVFGTMELALTYFAWNRVSEAARDGARYLIVSSPLADLSGQSCSAANPAVVTVACGSGSSCAGLMQRLQAHAPFLEGREVNVQYRCSGAGNPAAPDENRVRTVTLNISDVPHPQIISALTGLGWTGAAVLPAVSVSRTGEDLYSP